MEIFEKALVDLYTRILEYQAVAASYLGGHTLERIGRAIPKIDDFSGLVKDVQDKDEECRRIIALFDSKEVEDRHTQGVRVARLTGKAEQLIGNQQNLKGEHEKVQRWLSDAQYGRDHDSARRKLGQQYASSGKWLFESHQYKSWITTTADSSSIFWFRGHVGTGKTSIVSICIQHFLENLRPSDEERLAFFYCSGKEHQAPEALGVLRSLISQLAWTPDGSTIATPVKSLYDAANPVSGRGQPDIDQCIILLTELTAYCPEVTIVIDALDECSDSWILLSSLNDILSSPKGSVKIFLSSRMHVEVSDCFPQCVTISPEANRADVRHYIRTEVAKRERPDLEERLIDILSRRAQHM